MLVLTAACGKVVKAQPDAAPASTLTVMVAGGGHVTSMPAGLDCTDSCTHDFMPGETVTLTADARGANFAGWSGACEGITTCTVTVNGPTTVTATFMCAGSMTFEFTGAPETFIHPACATSIKVDVLGAGGGRPFFNGTVFGTASLGGRTQATLPIQPSDTITVFVGGAGGDATATVPGVGGYNGGADGANFMGQQLGGAGGGASDIRINGMALTDRVVVAGGAGGTSCCSGSPFTGGNGGDLIGANGTSCGGTGEVVATGGTQAAGGTGGLYPGYCQALSGSSGSGAIGCSPTGAGGGGGGYYGGGGGSWNAGAGGSSYTITTATDVVHTQGAQSGNGRVIISF